LSKHFSSRSAKLRSLAPCVWHSAKRTKKVDITIDQAVALHLFQWQ
jgi:hypothetical protein